MRLPYGAGFKGKKGSERADEAWSSVAAFESPERGQERPLTKVQPQLQWRPGTLEMPGLRDDRQEQ